MDIEKRMSGLSDLGKAQGVGMFIKDHLKSRINDLPIFYDREKDSIPASFVINDLEYILKKLDLLMEFLDNGTENVIQGGYQVWITKQDG